MSDMHEGSSSVVGYTLSWYFCSSSTVRSHRLFACAAVSSAERSIGAGEAGAAETAAVAAAAAAEVDDSASEDAALKGHMISLSELHKHELPTFAV